MLILPNWLASFGILALLGLQDLLSDSYSNRAVHLAEGAGAAGKLRGLEAEV